MLTCTTGNPVYDHGASSVIIIPTLSDFVTQGNGEVEVHVGEGGRGVVVAVAVVVVRNL